MGRGGTAVANPCADGSGMYFNPAGIAGLPPWARSAATLIWPARKWRNDDTQIDASSSSKTVRSAQSLPRGTDRPAFAMGFGVYVPYGLTTEWDHETFEGRFLGYKTSLKATLPPAHGRGAVREAQDRRGPRHHQPDVEPEAQARPVITAPARCGRRSSRHDIRELGVPYGTDFADAVDHRQRVGHRLQPRRDVRPHADRSRSACATSRGRTSPPTAARPTFTQDPTGLVLTGGNPLGLPAGTPVDALLAPQFQTGGPLVTQGVSDHAPAAGPAGHGHRGDADQALDRAVRCAVHLVGGARRDPARLRDPPTSRWCSTTAASGPGASAPSSVLPRSAT